MGGRTLMAYALSLCVVGAIFGLSTIEAKAQSTGVMDARQVARCLQSVVNALGILIGFSWTHSFRSGISVAKELTEHPFLTKLILNICALMILVPVWRLAIFEKVIFHQRMFNERLEAKDQRKIEHSYEKLAWEDSRR